MSWDFVKSYLMCVVVPLYLVSVLLYLIRILRGPTIADVVLGISSLSFDTCFFLTLLAVYYGAIHFVVAALMLSLWTFALDLYVAKYLELRTRGVRKS